MSNKIRIYDKLYILEYYETTNNCKIKNQIIRKTFKTSKYKNFPDLNFIQKTKHPPRIESRLTFIHPQAENTNSITKFQFVHERIVFTEPFTRYFYGDRNPDISTIFLRPEKTFRRDG